LTLFPPDVIDGDGFDGTAIGLGVGVVVPVVKITVGVVFAAGLWTTSDGIPLGNGCVSTVVSPTSRSTSSLK
jgi:hypothetical protein